MNQADNYDSPTLLLQRLHRWRMAFLGLIILIAGLVTGAATTVLLLPRSSVEQAVSQEPGHQMMLERIMPRLGLSPEQAREVEPVLRKHMQRLEEIRRQGRTQIGEELEAMDEDMASVLTPDQQRRWQDLIRGLPGQFLHGQGRMGLGPKGQQGLRGGGRGGRRGSSENPPFSPNEPTSQN